MTNRKHLADAARQSWRLGLTHEDQAANLFLFDRGRLSIQEITSRAEDTLVEESLFNGLVGALRVVEDELAEALDPAYDVCPKCNELAFRQDDMTGVRVITFKCRDCGHEYHLRRSAS